MNIETKVIGVPVSGKVYKFRVVADIDSLIAKSTEEDDIPFWAELWPASIALAEYLAESDHLAEKSIIELGAGLGLPGVVAASFGAAVTQSDYNHLAMEFCAANARLNQVVTRQIQGDWRNFPPIGLFDVCVASDILYEPKLYPYLSKVINSSVSREGRITIADPGREYAPGFIQLLEEQGWYKEIISKEIDWDGRKTSVRIYLLSHHG